MKKQQLTLFDDTRLTQSEAVELTAQSLQSYFRQYNHVAIAYSGGKDSTATVTCVLHLIEQGKIPAPKSLTVIYADTRLELPPLQIGAMQLLNEVEKRGFNTKVACAELDKRFLVYILGRGVPPPNNNTLRWCTQQIKLIPMQNALADVRSQLGPDERLLMLTGVRIGESAVRDRRIAMSCSKNGAECGQGWFQSATFEQTDTLSPLLHWRVCHIWDWLIEGEVIHGFPTMLLAQAYGGDEATEMNARTGCIGCPLATKDTALEYLVGQPDWAYLSPLLQLRSLWEWARRYEHRLQKTGLELTKSGQGVKNPNRKGPLTLESRLFLLEKILVIQSQVNAVALLKERPKIDLLNAEEESRIRELIALKTFPNKWTGDEPTGDILIDQYYSDGSFQPVLF